MTSERKKDYVAPDSSSGGAGRGFEDVFQTGIRDIGDDGRFPVIMKHPEKAIETTFYWSGEVSPEIKLLNGLSNICSMILKQTIYPSSFKPIPKGDWDQAEINQIKKKLDILVARPEFTNNKEILDELDDIYDIINLIPKESTKVDLGPVLDAIDRLPKPKDVDLTTLFDEISKIKTAINNLPKNEVKFDDKAIRDKLDAIDKKITPSKDYTKELNDIRDSIKNIKPSEAKNYDKELAEIKELIKKIDIPEVNIAALEEAIKHISENLPQIAPLIKRQNAAHRILQIIAKQSGIPQDLIDALDIPETEETAHIKLEMRRTETTVKQEVQDKEVIKEEKPSEKSE